MKLTILTVPFPFAPVNEDPVGGAEQVSANLDRALVRQGHRSIVIAVRGSRTAGTLVPVSRATQSLHTQPCTVHHELRQCIAAVLAREPVDLIHFHGVDFAAYLPAAGPPALVTLHLPIDWYPQGALQSKRPFTWFNPVSASQAQTAPPGVELLPFIGNGVATDHFPANVRKKRFALVLGRVCPEKGFHHAISASVHAGIPLLIAGEVFPWAAHQRYFDCEISPRLDRQRRWIGCIGGHDKRLLLAAARCVLVPSLAQETSSLVAMEALAAGTPVIAWRSGALPHIVDHGRTGYIVDDVLGMADAIGKVGRIDPRTCRAVARERFGLDRMIAGYFTLYRQLVGGHSAVCRTQASHTEATQC
jgi:glycosyltransferase involved in cell wall biosynthesis